MKVINQLTVQSRDEWHAWLEQHYDTEPGIWLVFFKKHTGKPTISYGDALDEALCFGWIDSILRRIDEARYERKFTPRQSRSEWSEVNKRHVRRLVQEGRMTEVGLAKIPPSVLHGNLPPTPAKRRAARLPAFMKQALSKDLKAGKNFKLLPPSARDLYIRWVMDAKKEETRGRRLAEMIALLKRNKRLGMK